MGDQDVSCILPCVTGRSVHMMRLPFSSSPGHGDFRLIADQGITISAVQNFRPGSAYVAVW